MSDEKKPTVWIIHDKGGYDFKQAESIGQLKTIFKGEFNPFDLHGARRHAEEVLKDSTPNDWLIGVGNGVAQQVAALVFVRLHDRLPVLVYHSHRREYVRRDLDGFYQSHS